MEPRPATLLRRGLLGLATAGIAGTAVELAFIRHWDSLIQLIPWAVLALLAAGVASVVLRPSPGRLRAVRTVAMVAAVAGLYGVYDHVNENHRAGPLDADYGSKWDSMSTISQWWVAATGGVGPSPTLAPAALTEIGLCLALATVGHPEYRAANLSRRSPNRRRPRPLKLATSRQRRLRGCDG